jgi:hypothetical protein
MLYFNKIIMIFLCKVSQTRYIKGELKHRLLRKISTLAIVIKKILSKQQSPKYEYEL